MPLAYEYKALEGATMVERKHPREVTPPLMTNISNMMLSRSDNTLTLRPDFDIAGIRVASYEDSLELEGSENDFVNSITGLYGTDNKVVFTSFFPLDKSNDSINELSQRHSTIICKRKQSAGTTASVTDGSNEVVLSDDTFNINKKAWPGCVIIFSDDPSQKYYVIKQIISKTNFLLETEVDFTDSETEFEVLQNHQYRNDGYKFHCEQFLSNLIYNTPYLDDNASLSRITGPWAANIVIFGEEGSFYGEYTAIPVYAPTKDNFQGVTCSIQRPGKT